MGGINWIAVLVATVLQMAAGALWYGAFGAAWMQAAGITLETVESGGNAIYGVAALGALAKSVFLAVLLARTDSRTAGAGLAWGAGVWLGVGLPVVAIHYAFQVRPPMLGAIDAGFDLVTLLIAGVLLSLWRPRRPAGGDAGA